MAINDGWAPDVQADYAVGLYKQFWDECEVIENDSLGKEEQVAQILDYGDVDKIIRIGGKQIHMAQRFRKPYRDKDTGELVDPDFTLRYSRPVSDHTIEYQRLMDAYTSRSAAYPRRYSFGRVYDDHERGLYELYILDTDELIKQIRNGSIREIGPIQNYQGQEFMAYNLSELRRRKVIVKEWEHQPRPDNPTDITAWGETDD
jgi:hypothetical protein